MQKITDLLNYPDGTPIDAVQGRVTAVYPARTVQGKERPSTVQNAELSDVGGNKIKLTVWDHPDLSPLKGNEYVLHNTGGTRYPGIKVKHGSYVAQKDGRNHKAGDTVKTIELNVTKNGAFQHIEVYNQSKPADKPAADPVSRPKEAVSDYKTGVTMADPNSTHNSGYINGASVGMAVNNAIEVLKHQGPINRATLARDIHEIASDILRVSQSLEKGNLSGAMEKTVAPTKAVAENSGEKIDEDVPF